MKEWLKKYKGKILLPVLIAAVLAGAYYYGGDGPGMRGWSAASDTSASALPSAGAASAPADSAVPEQTAVPETGAPAGEQVSAVPSSAAGGETAQTTQSKTGPDAGDTGETAAPKSPPAVTAAGTAPEQTAAPAMGKPAPVESENAVITDRALTCTLSISCATINDNLSWLNPDKADLVPGDGWILKPAAVTFYQGESVFHVLLRTCKQQGIQMEYEDTPLYHSAYIEGIQNLYEFDCGERSGWEYEVNGWFPNYGCSRYQLKDGDVVQWVYTCDLGTDVGGTNFGN